VLLEVTVAFLDLIGGAILGFALELLRLLTAITFLAHV
jgi:hypothetical protein